MFIYVLIIMVILFSIPLKVDRNNALKKKWIIVIFGTLTIISALRSYSVGVDSIQYKEAFDKIVKLDFSQSNSLRYEIGFFSFVKTLSLLNDSPQILFIVSSFIIIPSVGIFIYKYSKNVAFSSLLYILFNIFFFHMTGMRQSLALVLLLFAYDNLVKNNYPRFIILVVIASFFHSSAILFLPGLFIKRIKYGKNSYIITILLSILFFAFFKTIFLNITYLIGKYGGYIDSEDFGVSNYYGAFFQFLLTFIVYTFCHFRYLNQESRNDSDRISLILLGIDVICQIMAMKMNIIGRMNQYFWIYSIILVPNLVKGEKRSKDRLLLYFGIILMSSVYWIIIAVFRPEWNGAIPYIPFWDKI